MREYGEELPGYKPPLDFIGPVAGEAAVGVRYLTPHSKWSIHSTYQDNLHMLTLFRGGPVVWMSPADAATVNVKDNDWIEMYNAHGVVAARAGLPSHPDRHGTDVPRTRSSYQRAEIGALRNPRRYT